MEGHVIIVLSAINQVVQIYIPLLVPCWVAGS